MLAKRTFVVIFLSVALCLAGFSQTGGSVVVLQTELTNIQDSWLSNHLQNLIEENLQKYTDFTTVVDEAAEQKVKDQQRRAESTAHSESDIIEIGKLVNAKYALFSYARELGNAYTLTIHFTDLTTGVQRASITSQPYGKLEELYVHPGAVDEVTLALCERLGIVLTSAQKFVLQHGEGELTVNDQIELERKEQERFRQQMKDLDNQIIALKTSTEADAETQQKKLEALQVMNEMKLKAAQEREKRLREDQKKRQADIVAEESRKEESIRRRNALSAEIESKVKNLRAAKVQNANIMERIAFLETKKKTFNELQDELTKRKEEIDRAAEEEFDSKKAKIEEREWQAGELADGQPIPSAVKRRKDEIDSLSQELKARIETEKSAVEKELQPISRVLLDEIVTDYRNLENTTVTISSIRNEKDIQYSIGTFNGAKNYWPVLLYFYNDGKESIGQYQTSISYQAVTGKKPFSEGGRKEQEEARRNDFLNTVDTYNSLFARKVPVLMYEVDYTAEPWTVPSQYRICFKELRIKDTQSGKLLLKEEITNLDTIVSFAENQIKTAYYTRIISPKDKNTPAYLLYELALAAEKNGDDDDASNLMRRAADKKYTPALAYIERKEAEERERQRMEAQAKADEEERKRQEKEMEKRRKKAERDARYASPRLGFAFSGELSPSIQNYVFEIKKMGRMWYGGCGVNAWLKNKGQNDSWYDPRGLWLNLWSEDTAWDAFCGYVLFGISVPTKRLRPYIEFGGGMGGVEISKDAHFGVYGYAKGGLELRLSSCLSIDAFCKPQGTLYLVNTGEKYVDKDGKTQEKSESHTTGTVTGGISITFWKIR